VARGQTINEIGSSAPFIVRYETQLGRIAAGLILTTYGPMLPEATDPLELEASNKRVLTVGSHRCGRESGSQSQAEGCRLKHAQLLLRIEAVCPSRVTRRWALHT
jgi:hypothetical protein